MTTVVAGQQILAAHNNNLETRVAALETGSSEHTWQLRNSAAQTIGTGAFTALLFDTEDNDSNSLHSIVSNTDRVTVTKAGLYLIGGGVSFVGNGTGIRIIRATKNGTVLGGSGNSSNNLGAGEFAQVVLRPRLVQCIATDILRIEAWQNSGGNLNTGTTDYVQPSFFGHWLKD